MMERRSFLKVPMIVGVAFALVCVGVGRAAPDGKQLLELRKYTFATAEKMATFETFLREAAIPAFNRAGVNPVGVFKLIAADNPKLKLDGDPAELYVLLPHASSESLLGLPGAMDKDRELGEAGRGVLDAEKSDPAYARIETSLLLSFDGIPKVEVPTKAKNRILQMRIYESHSADRAMRKMDMFNTGGELALFRKVGLSPVFFGQAIAGANLPHLTYMLSFENDEARAKAWAAFLAHPDWERMKNDPTYKDTVSRITNLFLRPVDGSQI